MPSNAQYVPLLSQHDADEETVFDSEHAASADKSTFGGIDNFRGQLKVEKHGLRRWEWVTGGLLIVLSVSFFALWMTSSRAPKCTYVDKYYPANEAVEYIEHVKYQGLIRWTNPWRGDGPTPEVDAAWRRITTDVKPIRLTDEQLQKIGMEVTPTTVRLPGEEGGGYPAALEVTHHLQCMDMLRKLTYRDYYEKFDPAFQVEESVLMDQLDTCVEIIRQALMCYPDINMLTFYWVALNELPFPNLSSIHRCKNFDKIMDWAAKNAIGASPPAKVSGPVAEKTENMHDFAI